MLRSFLLLFLCPTAVLAGEEIDCLIRNLKSEEWRKRIAAERRLKERVTEDGDTIYEVYLKEDDPDTKVRLLRILYSGKYVVPEIREKFGALARDLKTDEPERIVRAAKKLLLLENKLQKRPMSSLSGFLRLFFKKYKPITVDVVLESVSVTGPETLKAVLRLTNKSPYAGWTPLISLEASGKFASQSSCSYLKPFSLSDGRRLPPSLPSLFPYLWLKPHQSISIVLSGSPPWGSVSFRLFRNSSLGVLLQKTSPQIFPHATLNFKSGIQKLFVMPPPDGTYSSSYISAMKMVAPVSTKPEAKISVVLIAHLKYECYRDEFKTSPLILYLFGQGSVRELCVVKKPSLLKGEKRVLVWAGRIVMPRKTGSYHIQGLLRAGDSNWWTPRIKIEVK